MIPIGETHDGRADMTNFEMDLFDTRMHTVKTVKDEEDACCVSSRNSMVKPACLPITIVSILIIALVFLPLFKDEDLESPFGHQQSLNVPCKNPCDLSIAESIPTGLTYPNGTVHEATWKRWVELVEKAEEVIDIAAFYWNLRDDTGYPTSDAGSKVFDALVAAGQRGVRIRIAQDQSGRLNDNKDSEYLREHAGAEVRNVNMTRLVGSGVLHTKFIIVDMANVYVGSANMDWKSLTEVKELGVVVKGCPCVAADLYRIFAVYWRLGEPEATIPSAWPISYRTQYNLNSPMNLSLTAGYSGKLFISSCPAPFNPKNREHDLSALLGLIHSAHSSVSIAVMDYIPAIIYVQPNRFWPDLDVALRDAAYRGVTVRLMASIWPHSKKAAIPFFHSLLAINDALPYVNGRKGSVEVCLFEVPSTPEQAKIPFARVNHNKFMVADSVGFIGTSNWSGDYFTNTAGVGFVFNSTQFALSLQKVFDRDWNSPYAKSLQK